MIGTCQAWFGVVRLIVELTITYNIDSLCFMEEITYFWFQLAPLPTGMKYNPFFLLINPA